MSTNLAIVVRQKLILGIPAEIVEVEDESYLHAGHAGNSGGHAYLRVRVVAKAFAGKSLVAQHRMVNALLAEELKGEIHALALETRAE
jgi:BolA protein